MLCSCCRINSSHFFCCTVRTVALIHTTIGPSKPHPKEGFTGRIPKVGGMGQVVLRFSETSVDEDEDRVGTGTCREAEFSELVGVGPVGDALARRWGRAFED